MNKVIGSSYSCIIFFCMLQPPTRPKVSGMLFERDENELATLDYVYIKSEDMPLEHSTPEHSPSIYSNQDVSVLRRH